MTELDFSKIFDKYSDELLRFAISRVTNQEVAKDLVQETFIKLWDYTGKGNVVKEPRAFLYTVIKNKIIVRVTDNGEGIEEEHIPRLFERFYRIDKSGSRKEGGSGLGLSIVKHIIEAHNENLYIESEFGVGSEFSFTLEKAK